MSVHSLGVSQSLWLCFKTERSYYYPRLLKRFPAVRMNAYAEATQREGNTLFCVYTPKITGFEIKELKNPFETRQRLAFKKLVKLVIR